MYFCRGYRIKYRQSYIWLAIIWLYSLFWALPPLFGWSRYTTEGFGTTCSYDYLVTDHADRYFLMCVVIGDFVMPLFIICYCYLWIMLKFRSHQQQYGSLLDPSKSRKSHRTPSSDYGTTEQERSTLVSRKASKPKLRRKLKSTEFKIARTVVFVVLIFCVSWTPYAVICLIGK